MIASGAHRTIRTGADAIKAEKLRLALEKREMEEKKIGACLRCFCSLVHSTASVHVSDADGADAAGRRVGQLRD